MECWTPLFDIFLNSPCPESEASLWLTKSFSPSSNTTPISTSSFLSLLSKLSDNSLAESSSSLQEKRVMWIQSLPDLVQARILSFLAYDYQRFCKEDLCKLARTILSEGKGLDFWVKKVAQQLLDLVSVSNYEWLSDFNLDSEEEIVDDEFYSLPDWLKNAAKESQPLFPWLPISPNELNQKMAFSSSGVDENIFFVDLEEKKEKDIDEVMEEVDVDEFKFDDSMDDNFEKAAKSLKEHVLNLDSASEVVELANEIRQLCLGSRQISLEILNLIEPWNVEDEIAAVLVSRLSDPSEGDELGFPSHVLCSVILPKLLILNKPPSRVLMDATIEYCKSRQRSAEYGLLFPLILRNEGINNPICNVMARIFKECFHPAHVSAFFHKLLGKDKNVKKFACLPCHRYLIGDELVATEDFFSFLQNILNHNVHLTQDSVDQLVHIVCEVTDRYSKSLKFCNFLLCLVNKCGPLLKAHKLSLTVAVENTDTLVTKSLLLKLSGL